MKYETISHTLSLHNLTYHSVNLQMPTSMLCYAHQYYCCLYKSHSDLKGRETNSSRVFSNTNTDTGIYFEAPPPSSSVPPRSHRNSPLLLSSSLTSSSPAPQSPPPPVPHQYRLGSAASSQWSREDSLEHTYTTAAVMARAHNSFSFDATSQTTNASDYEEPVPQSGRRQMHTSQPRNGLSQYETVH